MDSILEIKKLYKIYGENKKAARRLSEKGASKAEILSKTRATVALNNISLEIARGEIFVIIGLSGSGKSTLIRMFNLLNTPTSGEVLFKGRNLADFSSRELRDYRRNNISMVFQNFGLMSHRNVLDNIAYGLEVKGLDLRSRQARAREMMEMVGLSGLEDHSIDSLSGGMKQRVGIARGLATGPDILLMDEPFSALDPLVKKDMQFELLSIQEKLATTIVFITHDIDEAFMLGDRVAILKDGALVQMDSPLEISKHPANDYVRDFIGSVDKSQLISVEDVMIRPNSLVRLRDNPELALKAMRQNGVSSAYVVGPGMKFEGIITLDQALRGSRENLGMEKVLIRDVLTTSPQALLKDIMDLAVEASFPLAVINEDGKLRGIVSKVHILTSIK